VWRLRSKLWQQKNQVLHNNRAVSHSSFFTKEFFA
jgi:hypothetical protein